MESMVKFYKTWTLIDSILDKRVISIKWVYKQKFGLEGLLNIY